MDQPPQDSQRPKPEKEKEKKSPPAGNNLIWYLLALGVGTLFVASLLAGKGRVKIVYGDLRELIQQGAPDRNPEASIEVTEGSGSKEMTVRYSDLRKLKFGPATITGTVTRQVLAPEEKKTEPQPDTSFQTDRLGLQNDNNALFDLAVKNGFTQIRAEEPPSGWGYYSSMIVFMLLFAMILFFMMRRLGGTGSAMAFGRSRGKLFAQEDIDITFEDVAGIDEAVD